MVNPLLSAYVQRRMNEPTVILSFQILLNNHFVNGVDARMTKTEIETEFNRVHEQYGIATFRRDYVLRQCGHDENAIDQRSDLFFIKREFLDGMVNADYRQVLDEINLHWTEVQNTQSAVITEIEDLIASNNLETQKRYVTEMLTTREAVKRGQAFEVSSFAVLKTYLNNLGFSLNRFSTTYSNDGGIDFVAQNAVYQVTTKLSERKFEEDIKKVTGKPRVLVYKETVAGFNFDNFNHDLVLNHIGKDELVGLLDYLVTKSPSRNIHSILSTMLEEFQREFYQNTNE